MAPGSSPSGYAHPHCRCPSLSLEDIYGAWGYAWFTLLRPASSSSRDATGATSTTSSPPSKRCGSARTPHFAPLVRLEVPIPVPNLLETGRFRLLFPGGAPPQPCRGILELPSGFRRPASRGFSTRASRNNESLWSGSKLLSKEWNKRSTARSVLLKRQMLLSIKGRRAHGLWYEHTLRIAFH